MPGPPARMKILLVLGKNFQKIAIKLFSLYAIYIKTRVSLKYFVTDSLWKAFFDLNLPQIPSNLSYLTILVNLRPFTMF